MKIATSSLYFLIALLCWLVAMPAFADPLADEAQEARAQHLFTQVRCIVCQGESVAESQAFFAEQTRHYIREQVKAEVSDAAILLELQQRFGDEVLMNQAGDGLASPLWAIPLLLLVLGGWKIYRMVAGADINAAIRSRAKQHDS